ncbi:hypothetical protein [Catenulispora subtropica]|uniref:WXG100 family type VII secretion target n=1 Tax=Catenulispora subtropica TaxID=450798 RepID=A0ABP5EAJ9_9ACTN
MPDQPTPEQSFSIHLKSLTDFAAEFTTQIESIQAPMDHLAAMSATPPQYGAFAEAWSLGAGEQAAIEEMYSLLGQVKQAIAFAGTVTGTVAEGYQRADDAVSSALGGAPPLGSGHHEGNGHPGHSQPWQNTQVTPTQIVFPDPGAPDPGAPLSGSPMTAPPVTDVSSVSVSHLVTGDVAGGPLPVWTPPPAPDPGPDPSWTDYFQGIPQGGA